MDRDRVDIDWGKMGGIFLAFLVGCVICGLLALLSGCTRRVYVPVETVRHDSVMVQKMSVDTLIVKDSVYERVQGDTLYYYKYRTEYKYKYLKDTAYVAKIDSIAVPYEVEKRVRYVPRVVWWTMGGMLFVIIIMGLILKVRFFS